MPDSPVVERKRWLVEHSDATGLIDVFQYDDYATAREVADQTWEEQKDQPGHVVKIYHRESPDAPGLLVYTAGQP